MKPQSFSFMTRTSRFKSNALKESTYFHLQSLLQKVGPSYFRNNQESIEIALKTVKTTELSRALLLSNSSATCSRVIGALIAMKDSKKAALLKEDLASAGVLFNAETRLRKTQF